MDSKKRCREELKKPGWKKKALEDDAAKCAKLTNIFSRRQTSTRELATQGNLQWLVTFTVMHLANAFIQSDLYWRNFVYSV